MRFKVCVFLLLFLPSCVSHRTIDALDRAEVMLSDAPDSALAIVYEIPQKTLTTRSIRARHALLITRAKDKCYMDIVEDSTIHVAYDWYRYYGSQRNHLMSAYYLGVIQQNVGNDIDAAISFREAERLAAELKEFRWQSLCNQHLCAVYSKNYDRLSAMSYAKQSLKAAEMAEDTLMAGYCRLDMADQYIAQNKLDTAEVLLNDIMRRTEDTFLLSYASRSLAKLHLLKPTPDYSEAEKFFDYAFSSENIPLSSQDYAFLSLLAEHNGDSDLSNRYCAEAEKTMLTSADSVSFYITLTNMNELRGDYQQSYSCYGKAMAIQDRIVYAQLEQSITHAMENYYQNQSDLEITKGKYRQVIFSLIAALLIGIITWLLSRLRKARQEIVEKMAQIQDFNNDLEYLESKDSVSSLLLDYYIKDKIKSLNFLANAYFTWDSDYVRQKEKRIGSQTKEELVELFQKQLESFRKNDGFYSYLEDSLNVSHHNLMIRAREQLRAAKMIDFELVALFFSGFSAKSICFLKDMTEASVRMRKTRLKQFFAALPDNQGLEFVRMLEHKDP